MIRVSFIINATRKPSNYTLDVLSIAKKSSKLRVEICYTEYEKHAEKLAFQRSENCDIIVAVGGDGTNHEVIEGIYKSGNRAIILGIIPNGTGNDFFKNLNPILADEFVRKLEQKSSSKIDVGEVLLGASQSVFLNIADIGFGVKVVELMNRQRILGIKGKLSYATAIIRAFFAFKKISIFISGDEFTHKGKVLMVAFCNGTTFSHGLIINPMAKIDSSKLEVTVIGNVSLLTYVKYLGQLKKGIKIVHPEVHYYQTERLLFSNINPHYFMEADGEILGKNIREIRVVKNGLNLLNPLK